MKTILIDDDPTLLEAAYTCTDQDSTIITSHSVFQLLQHKTPKAHILHFDSILADEPFELINSGECNKCILCFERMPEQEKALELLEKAGLVSQNCILIQKQPAEGIHPKKNSVVKISICQLIQEQVRIALEKLKNLQRLERLKEINNTADEVLILMQHDPDPDALASGLALRTLLDRNRQTAPLGSFGAVTRSENINMIRILDIPVLKITDDMLDKFSCIAMVDVQPPYFVESPIHADMVFDHHPYSQTYTAAFTDIRTSYGATSTILGQYLLDAGIALPQRLSTALVYGIKTDTMSLERDITHADLDVFTRLYPKANISMIRQIESASLDMHEIKIFIKALQNLTMIGAMACTWLGHIKNEAMIPRLADFSLQVAGAEWSFAAGISQQMVVCSARNVGYVRHAGELMHKVFGRIGSAGGHRSTAKAVIPLSQFKKYYKVRTSGEIAKALFTALDEANR